MIELSSTTAFTIYLSLTLGVVFGIWIYHHFTSRRKKISILQQELQICEYCHCAYLATTGVEITQCPQCQSFNKS